jgi:uncharacterized integral membrane protein (TIGR00698 family)
MQRAMQGQIFQRNDLKRAGLDLASHREAGNDRHTQTGNDRVFDGFGAGEGKDGLDGDPAPLQRPLDDRPRAGAFLAQDERFVAEVPHQDIPLLRQRMAGRRDGHQLVLREDFRIQLLRLDQALGKRDLDFALAQPALNLMRVGDFQPEFDLRILAVIFAQQPRQEIRANRRARAHSQPTLFEPAKFFNRPHRLLLERNQLPRITGQELPGFRQPAAPWQPVEQAHAEGALQFADLFGHGGLADARVFRAPADAARMRHRMKEGEVIPIHDITVGYAKHTNNVFVALRKIPAFSRLAMKNTVQLNEQTATPVRPGTTPPGARNFAGIATAAIVVVVLIVWATPPVALLAGMGFALFAGNPLGKHGHKVAKRLLQACVVMLGFGMNLPVILRAGWDGSLFAGATIATTLLLGYGLGRWLNLNRNTTALISAGTAICGGSAIAAVGSVLVVAEGEIAVALGTVFLLNAVALYLFPLVGHALHLSPHQFGVWAGVAIHDISSVVGAAMVFGGDALETATAVKLSRTLWIIPVTLGLAIALGRKARPEAGGGAPSELPAPRKRRVEIPWFIGLFLLASLARSYWPVVAEWSAQISHLARVGLTAVLFLIGASLSLRTLRAVGWKAAGLGLALWVFISTASLAVVLYRHAEF